MDENRRARENHNGQGAPAPQPEEPRWWQRLPTRIKAAISLLALAPPEIRPLVGTIVACISILGIGRWFGLSTSQTMLGVLGTLLLIGIAAVVTYLTKAFPAWLQLAVQVSFVMAVLSLVVTFLKFAWFYGGIEAKKLERGLDDRPPPPIAALDHVSLALKKGSTYFASTTEQMQHGSYEDRQKTSQRLLIKEALSAMSNRADDWQSLVLTAEHLVEATTHGGTYALDVYPIEKHGVDYNLKDRPLVAYLGWVERIDKVGWLHLLPIKSQPDTSAEHFQIKFTFPDLEIPDRVVIVLQRRPMAQPSSFTESESFTLT